MRFAFTPFGLAFSVYAAVAGAGCSSGPNTPTVRFTAAIERPGGTWQAFRVVDGITGRPIAGAELFLIEEANTPLHGEFHFLPAARSDADGFVSVESSEHPFSWMILRAPGYGSASFFRGLKSQVWPLAPGIDVPVQIADWLDRPVPGAGAGFCIGCGHTPDVANAVADEHGIAILRGIDLHTEIADVYPRHPGLGIHSHRSIHWSKGDPPARVRAARGLPVHGRVLDPEGRPVTRGVAGTRRGVHRGPWTRIQADGSFRIDGVEPGSALHAVVADHEYVFELFEDAWREPLTLRLPVANDDSRQHVDLPEPEGRKGRLLLRCEDAAGRPETDLDIVCVGPLPLRHRYFNEDDDWGEDEGLTDLELVAGTYEVHCSGKRHVREIGRVEVLVDQENRRTLRPVPLPTLRLDVPADCTVDLLCRGIARDVTGPAVAGAPIPIPIDEDFGFAIRNQDDERILAVSAAAARAAIDQQEALKLRFLPPTLIRGRLLDPHGEPIAARVALLPAHESYIDVRTLGDAPSDSADATPIPVRDGRIELASRNVGLHFLAVRPERKDLRPLLLPISLPERGEDVVVDLGRLEPGSTPRLRFVTAAGTPYTGDPPGCHRLGWHDVRRAPPTFPLDADGGWLGHEPRAGDAIVVPSAKSDLWATSAAEPGEAYVDVPFRTVLEGAGPWTITVPAGRVQLDVRDEAGAPLDATVFVADRTCGVSGRLQLRQLPAGDTELFVTAPGRKTARAVVPVPAEGQAELRLVLPLD